MLVLEFSQSLEYLPVSTPRWSSEHWEHVKMQIPGPTLGDSVSGIWDGTWVSLLLRNFRVDSNDQKSLVNPVDTFDLKALHIYHEHIQTHTTHTQNKGEARSSSFRLSAISILPSLSFWGLSSQASSYLPRLFQEKRSSTLTDIQWCIRRAHRTQKQLHSWMWFISIISEKNTHQVEPGRIHMQASCVLLLGGVAQNFSQHQNAAACGQYFCAQKPIRDSESRFLMVMFY